jgi:arylsulfatase A-like enzyme
MKERGGMGVSDKPNILFFFTDDQRFDTIAALGNNEIITPNLDALVARGTAMTNAYIPGGTSGAVCMPSRAMLMTGRTLFHLDRQGQDIPADHVMLGECLQQAGYATFGTGKWHNGTTAYARSFTDGGEIMFGGMNDHWNVPACDFHADGNYPEPQEFHARWGTVRMRLNQRCDHVGRKHSSELFCDETIDFLRARRPQDRPFFAYISFMAPHDPREMPVEFLNMYDPDRITLPPNFLPKHPFDNGALRIRDELLAGFPRTEEEVRRHLADYYAMITHADAQIGRVLETLDEIGEADNTIVVFAGDNGLAIGQHGLMGKQSLYEHSIHVPLLFAGPGVPAGQRRDAFCYLLDIFPTLCDLTGVGIPETVEGRSLAPILQDAAAPAREKLIFAYTRIHRGARDDRYKLIEYAVDGKRTTQLFDLLDDPHEMNNLADAPEHAEPLVALRTEMRRWRDEFDDTADEFWQAFDAD